MSSTITTLIVRISDGLGNQMFQYALGRTLAAQHNTPLILDISSFKHDKLRTYGLDAFNIQENFLSQPQSIEVKLRRDKSELVKGTKFPSAHQSRLKVYREWQLSPFNPDVMTIKGRVYLYGFWQTEKYFTDAKELIRTEFNYRHQPTPKSIEVADQIATTTSVSLHIRRGDYVSNPGNNRVHGTCNLQYYQTCIDQLVQSTRNPHFFIFSDDPHWAKANLALNYPTTLVTHNQNTRDAEDLWLMSQCQHHIIANSTFSWWAAWLNRNPNAMTFAPKRWFNQVKINTGDLIPSHWIRV